MAYIQTHRDFQLINKYNENGNLILHMTSDGDSKEYRYDKNDNLIYFNDAKNKIEEIKIYDDKNRLCKTTRSDGKITEIEYIEDNNGNLIEERTKITNKNTGDHHIVIQRYEYFEDGSYKITYTGDSNTTKTEIYDSEDRLILESSDRFSRIFNYDDKGRKIKKINTLGLEEIWKYDNNDNLSDHIVNRNGRITFRMKYEYDKYGRLIKEKNYNGVTVKYYYENNNHIVHMKADNGYYENIFYDDKGRKVKVENNTEVKNYKYDDNNHLIMFTKTRKTGDNNDSKEIPTESIKGESKE